ncbi:MAG: DNA-3-methyladenine glycosylase, partial [Oscillibacter sp.]|nr:DNA-3-methyladenine glycosylase [Oscillibacter sp.]
MARLSSDFYDRDTVEVARALLGKIVVRRPEGEPLLAGRITETEAYIGRCDR